MEIIKYIALEEKLCFSFHKKQKFIILIKINEYQICLNESS